MMLSIVPTSNNGLWTVTDPSGQSATATQIVTISDVAPTITAPIAVSVPANSLGGATGVSLGVPVVGSIAYDVSVLTMVNDAPALFPLRQQRLRGLLLTQAASLLLLLRL